MELILVIALLWVETAIFLRRHGSSVGTGKAVALISVSSLASHFLNLTITPSRVYGIAALHGSARLAGMFVWWLGVSSVIEYAIIMPFVIRLKAMELALTVILMNLASHLILAAYFLIMML